MNDVTRPMSAFAVYNRAAVIDLLRVRGAATRRELANLTGLSRTGLGSVLEQLTDEGLIREADAALPAGRAGRPPRVFTLAERVGVGTLVLSVRPRRLEAALVDESGVIHEQASRTASLQIGADESLRMLIAMAREVSGTTGGPVPRSVVVSLPTLVHDNGEVDYFGARELMPTWVGDVVVRELDRELGLPARVTNETSMSAIAEYRALPAGSRARCVLFVKVGAEGTGMAIIVDGRPFGGETGIAGQIGHVSVRPQGVRCPCGQRGCIAAEIDAQIREEVERRAVLAPGFTADDLIAESASGEASARRLFYDIGSQLAYAVGAAINILEPGIVIVGGDLSTRDNGLLEGLKTALPLSVHPGVAQKLSVVGAELGTAATLVGAGIAAGEWSTTIAGAA